MNMPLEDCKALLEEFDETVPYVSLLARSVSNVARDRGWIRLLLGHKRHFNLYQPKTDYGEEREGTALPLAAAQARWPGRQLERAWTYKAFNSLCQGGAAGQTKKAMVEIARAIGVPQMQVHDEISKSIQSEKEAKIIEEIMVNCIPLLSPVRVDGEIGKTWC